MKRLNKLKLRLNLKRKLKLSLQNRAFPNCIKMAVSIEAVICFFVVVKNCLIFVYFCAIGDTELN